MKPSIILCGLPGTGKTETGKRLAARLAAEYIDTDIHLEQFYERLTGNRLSCRELYRKIGEREFRELENQLFKSWEKIENKIVSIGGGTLNHQDNIRILKNMGRIVYLKNQRKVIFDRLLKKGLPAYLDPSNPLESFEKLADKREKIFESTADVVFDTGSLAPDEIAQQLVEKMTRG